ncbi:MAG: trigger factor [Anaerolineales bacterium]|nr:trigger factor [Anaerolineales bacterium]
MKIEKQLLDDHQMQLTVEVETELMEASKRRAARQIAQRGKIPGFRPGKAPYDVIVRNYGEAAIVEQAMDLLVDDIYPKVLEEAEIKPAAAGSLEKIEELDPPKLIFRVPLAPEIDLGDYRSIRLPYKYSAPGKKELDAALDEFRRMYATTETVERAVEIDDYVLVDVKGERAKPKDEEDRAAALSRSGYALVVRKEARDDEWPYPGFSKELIGMNPGKSKTVKHKFSKDDSDESLRGETVNFEVTMKTVRSMTLPELDDELAKMTGQYETLEELKETLQKDLETRAKAEYDDEYYLELIDKIKAGAIIKYPPQVVEHEAEHVVDDLRQRLSQQGLDLETYFKMRQTTQEQFLEEEAKPVAIKRLERSLILDQLARGEKIEVDDSALQNEFGQALTELQYQGMDFSKMRGGKKGQQQMAEAIAMESANRLITRRTLERIKAIATGEYKPEETETVEKPKKASAGKKASKSAEKKAEGETKAKQSAPIKSAETKPKSASKKGTTQKAETE